LTGPRNVTFPFWVMIFTFFAVKESESSAMTAFLICCVALRSLSLSPWSSGVGALAGVASLFWSRSFTLVLSGATGVAAALSRSGVVAVAGGAPVARAVVTVVVVVLGCSVERASPVAFVFAIVTGSSAGGIAAEFAGC
jgi:hypothetical protein